METHEFEALGTQWWIGVDQALPSQHWKEEVEELCRSFERRWSRFLPDSQLSQLNQSSEASTVINEELATMLEFARGVSRVSQGHFDVNLGEVMKGFGYTAGYSFKPNEEARQRQRGSWSVKRNKKGQSVLIRQGLVKFDLGAIGKGYLIDLIAEWLKAHHIHFFLIDGGRDFFGTTRRTGEGWQIGLEHPQDLESAIGQINLKNQALAGSGTYLRKVGKFHHLIDLKTHQPARSTQAVFVVADSAMVADGVGTAISVSPPELWGKINSTYRDQKTEYCVVLPDLHFTTSSGWGGEIFS